MEARRGVLLLSAVFLVTLGLDLVVACQEKSRCPTKITYLCEGVGWWKVQHLFMPRITTTSCPSKVRCTFLATFSIAGSLKLFDFFPVSTRDLCLLAGR